MTKNKHGFTLIELLIVIAILGTLAVVVLLALNPVQQLARTRDAGRSSGVTQLGHAMEAYATVNSAIYPAATGVSAGCASSTDWLDCLVDSGEIAALPAQIADTVGNGPCTTAAISSTWCYDTDLTNSTAIVFAMLESASNQAKCASGNPYIVYSTAAGRGGGVCSLADPTSPVAEGDFDF